MQLFHIFLCNSQNYHPTVALGHPQHRGCDSFDCFAERYEIVVLLPNSELTKDNNKLDADAGTEDHGEWAL